MIRWETGEREKERPNRKKGYLMKKKVMMLMLITSHLRLDLKVTMSMLVTSHFQLDFIWSKFV